MSICERHSLLFISRETSTGDMVYRKSAYVCKECGRFVVWVNGEKMTFELVTDEQVAAAGVYAERLRALEVNG